MAETLSGIFIFILGIVLLWLGLFRFDWILKGIREIDRGKLDLLPSFISDFVDYWFWKIVFIGMGLLLVFVVTSKFLYYIF